MASTILLSDNGASSGSAGLKSTAGNDGVLILQTTTSGGTATNAVYVDTVQNVGFSFTPSAWVSGDTILQVKAGSGTGSFWGRNGTMRTITNGYFDGTNYRYTASSLGVSIYECSSGLHTWANAASGTAGSTFTPAESMRIDISGNLVVGYTGNYVPSSTNSIQMFSGNLGTVTRQTKPFVSGAYSTSAGLPQWFSNWASSGNWGIGPHSGNNDSIIRIGVATTDANGAYWTGAYAAIYAGAYTNASDYRIKENVVDVENGVLEKVLALRVVNYNIIGIPDEDGDLPQYKEEIGFIAHEIQEHFPVVVSGEKDAVDGNGDALHQGVDYAKMSAVLTKAIQEQQALITTLTERITALEAK
jgi:hypothetical protein